MRLIDADAIINICNSSFWPDTVKMRINELPTIDAVPVVHGEWKETPYTDYDDTWECSVCGEPWTLIEGTPQDNLMNYCPKCGAKMDGGDRQ